MKLKRTKAGEYTVITTIEEYSKLLDIISRAGSFQVTRSIDTACQICDDLWYLLNNALK